MNTVAVVRRAKFLLIEVDHLRMATSTNTVEFFGPIFDVKIDPAANFVQNLKKLRKSRRRFGGLFSVPAGGFRHRIYVAFCTEKK